MAYPRNNGSIVYLEDPIVILVHERPQIRAEEPARNDLSGRMIRYMLTVYVNSHGTILMAVFSLQRPIGPEIRGSILILSGVISTAAIAVILHIFYIQYSDLTRGGPRLGIHNALVENWRWIAWKSAFLFLLIGISICLFFICSRLP